MSRHRFVKNLNIHDELAVDRYDEEDVDEIPQMTPEQRVQLDSASAEVRRLLGPEDTSGFSNDDIRAAVWDSYFDVEESVKWLLDEQAKAREREAALAAKKKNKIGKQPAKEGPSKKGTPSQSGNTTPTAQSRAATPTKRATKTELSRLAVSNAASQLRQPHLSAEDPQQLDMAALGLQDNEMRVPEPESPKIAISKEKLMGEVRRTIEKEALEGIKSLSIVVIGHVDAGKSTLMGHLLYALGRVGDKKRIANERASEKLGKASFSWAWELDGTQEERERGVTMDVAIQSFTTPHRRCTVLDAPGHRDFIPKMISGASQADCALLVVDAAAGEFEAGFDRGGQTREHLVLVRSLGVSQVVVAINKMDQVSWSRQRYEEIMGLLQTFLMQTGFAVQRIQFVPVGAMLGVNLVDTNQPEAEALRKWYSGPTLADLLDVLTPPPRLIESPMRLPLTNVFRGQTSVASGIAVSGRLSSGIIQVGERVSVLPGDETAVIKIIEVEEESVPWAAAGSSVTLYLSGIDPVQLGIGTVLCPPSDPVPLASSFVAQIVVFDIQVPIIAGASVELFHHSRDIPATVTKLLATVERSNGTVIKANPRVLTKSVSAKIQINIRTSTMSGQAVRAMPIPLEPFHVSKELGRILLRRNGETIAAGIVLEVLD